MKNLKYTTLLLGMLFITGSAASSAQTLERELHVVVEFDAAQSWQSDTEEFGKEFYEGSSEQRYELKTRLRAEPELKSRNLLDPDQAKRLEAKTIHLARQAREKLAAAGKPVQIPNTPQEKQALARQMQERQFACEGDARCRRNTMELYAAIFAAAEYPEAAQPDPGPGRYRYYEPYPNCGDYSKVTMQVSIEGEHYNRGEKEVVPFSEKRSADAENPEDDIPLCQRFLAVIDTQDEDEPLYLENFYLPSARGETTITELGNTSTRTERQPMAGDVLAWVTAQLKHAPVSGRKSQEVRLIQPLNGISEDTGTSQGQADVSLRWEFSEPASPSPAVE